MIITFWHLEAAKKVYKKFRKLPKAVESDIIINLS